MAEYSRLAKGSIVSTGAPQNVILPFQPDYVELINYTAATTPATGGVPFAWWDYNMGQGAAVYDVFNATPVLTTATTLVNGISTFAVGTSLQYGAPQQVVSATATINPTFTVTNHGYSNGDTVIFQGLYQTPTTGMPQMAGIPFYIFNVTANTFAVSWVATGSNYTALSGSPAGATVKRLSNAYLYSPDVSILASVSVADPTVYGPQAVAFVTTHNTNFVVGQEIAFRIPPQWGDTSLNSLPNNIIPGSPIYGYIIGIMGTNNYAARFPYGTLSGFNSNVPVASLSGLNYPQVLAVGDINSGGTPYTGKALYPSPIVNGVSTINGPAISGAFINNTSQGFNIGSVLAGASTNVIYWRAFLHDYSNP
jgi:hypothetical protein